MNNKEIIKMKNNINNIYLENTITIFLTLGLFLLLIIFGKIGTFSNELIGFLVFICFIVILTLMYKFVYYINDDYVKARNTIHNGQNNALTVSTILTVLYSVYYKDDAEILQTIASFLNTITFTTIIVVLGVYIVVNTQQFNKYKKKCGYNGELVKEFTNIYKINRLVKYKKYMLIILYSLITYNTLFEFAPSELSVIEAIVLTFLITAPTTYLYIINHKKRP